MLLELKRFDIPPGQKVFLKNVDWNEFEQILEELGEHRATKISYYHQLLEIMTPLPEHERNKENISDLIKCLLEVLEIEFCTLGSTTFKNQLMESGIEPDNCFYIKNEVRVRNKNRLDLSIDPPPDLVLEVDVTSRTHPEIYLKLGVPELWRFESGKLQINLLQEDSYYEVNFSPYFPNLPLKEVIPDFLDQMKIVGRNQSMKAFRTWIQETLQ